MAIFTIDNLTRAKMIISTKELELVRHEEDDPKVVELLHDPEILESMSEARSYPAAMPSTICFSIEKDRQVIGQACLKRIRWINHKAEISLFITGQEQGNGYGRIALEAIVAFGFNRLNLYRLEAEVVDGNVPSMKLMKKLGFTEEGRLREAKFVNGKYHDLLRYGMLRREYGGQINKSS